MIAEMLCVFDPFSINESGSTIFRLSIPVVNGESIELDLSIANRGMSEIIKVMPNIDSSSSEILCDDLQILLTYI